MLLIKAWKIKMSVREKMRMTAVYVKKHNISGLPWDDIYDFQKIFNTRNLSSISEYMEAEDKVIRYIIKALSFIESDGVTVVNPSELQVNDHNANAFTLHGISDIREYNTGDFLTIKEAEVFSRLAIRELIGMGVSAKINGGDGIFVFFPGKMRIEVGFTKNISLPMDDKFDFFDGTNILLQDDIYDPLADMIA